MIWTPPIGLRFGNWMYLWLQAWERTENGTPVVVRQVPDMSPWLRAFPALRGLTIDPAFVRFHDRREWDHTYRYQRYGVDFTPDALGAFSRSVIAPYVERRPANLTVVNIRRGDYFTPDTGGRFVFDQLGYLEEALAGGPSIERLEVVSDDAEWCRQHAHRLLSTYAESVHYAPPDPLANFLAVAGARRIIGTNSTFGYWGAYVADVLFDELANVTMPRFHARMAEGSDAYQLDPRWTIIEGHH